MRVLVMLLTVTASAQTLPLSMRQAVEIALEPGGATRVNLAVEAVHQAESRKGQARAALLPLVESQFTQDSRTINLQALGVQSAFQKAFDFPLLKIEIPSEVGPFTVADARATGSQTIFDLSAIRRYQAANAGVSAARAADDAARDAVAAQVAKTYLAALRAEASLEAATANVDLAEALLDLAQNQLAVGTGTGIDVSRAQVQLQNERQLLLVAQNQRTRARLELLRSMGMELDTEIELTDELSYQEWEIPSLEEALPAALRLRGDWLAQQQRERSASLTQSAVKWERLPVLRAFGNYGTIGNGLDDAIPTRTYGIQLSLPVFDGGRRDYRRGEAASLYREERIRTSDLRDQIELEIRLALDGLESASDQVRVAEEGLAVAGDEVARAERRFRSGITNSIEVTDAQSRLARARENRIAALTAYLSAQLALGEAMGTVEEWIR